MRLWDDKGREITLGRQIGRAGGEGKVHEIRGQSAFVAKIYHSPADGQKAEKLIQMTRMTSEKLLKTCAWPVRLILDERKKTICGVTMPIVRGKEVHKLYSPRDRYREFPKYTWKELVWVARNITSAFDIIHTQGIVMGDVNEGNVLVNDNGTVTLIDCDSYQISTNGKSYVCDVGIGLWTPPELQNANLSRVARTENHDLFGLAQLVFLLLFMGRHPFAGIPINNEDYEIEEAIRRYLFAYGSNQSQVRPPDIALRLDHLPTNCQSLFLRAFSRGSEKPRNRPPAKEWSECLGYLTKNLRACSYDSGHSYPVHLHSCPWCELFRKHGINFFWTAVTIIQTQGETANLLQFVQAISRLEPIPQNSRAPSSYTAPTLTGTPFGGSRTNPTFIWGFVVIAASALLVSAGLLFAVLGIFVGIGMVASGRENPEVRHEKSRREAALRETTKRIDEAYQRVMNSYTNYCQEFQKKKKELTRSWQRLQNWDSEVRQARMTLENKKRDIQLRDFLDRKLIARSRIPNFAEKRKATLAAYGIESALDIRSGMRVPGIGPSLQKDLMSWRLKCESAFRYNPNEHLPGHVLRDMQNQLANTRRDLEADIRSGPEQLKKLNQPITWTIKEYETLIPELLRQKAQAQTDFDLLN